MNLKRNSILMDFMEELVGRVAKRFPDQIVSIVLFGSATTNEWVRGKSDIDFIVIVKDKKDRKIIERYLHQTLLDLDIKYNLELAQICTTYRKTRNLLLDLLLRIESFMMFGIPFYVLSLDQIDFMRGKVKDNRIRFITSLFDSLSIFFIKMKQTGLVIYGENLLERFHPNISRLEKVKTALAPLWLLFVSIMILPLDAKFSLQRSVKASIWACEDVLFALDKHLSTAKEEIRLIKILFKDIDFKHVERCFNLKYQLIVSLDNGKDFVSIHIINSFRFIFTLYWHALRMVLHKTSYK